MADVAIGIDLGTTNSCVSIFLNNKVKIIKNNEGKSVTPSYLFYPEKGEIMIGHHAKRLSVNKPEFAVHSLKRLLGRKLNDAFIQENLKHILYKIESTESNDPIIVIDRKNDTFRKSPQELCSLILQKLKLDAEQHLQLEQKIEKVVITVPAYFNIAQREATLAAAEGAGFTVLKLLNEPTAAALSYYHSFNFDEENYSLVYDLGGGTFDVAILKRSQDTIKIVGVGGNSQLGGHDFDNILVDFVCQQLEAKYNYNIKVHGNKIDLRRLHSKCEDAKKELSSLEETTLSLNAFIDNVTMEITVTRELFNSLCQDKFDETITIVDGCLKNCQLSKNMIKEVILAGGSTRIPKIREMISEYFDGKNLNQLVNPDECVAEGAALQAAMLSTNPNQSVKQIQLQDVVPFSIGFADYVDMMDFPITRNTPIPVSKTRTYSTSEINQKNMLFRVYEGEFLNAKKNRFLGEMTIRNITPAPAGQCKVTVTISIDANGILKMVANEMYQDNCTELKVDYNRGNISEIKSDVNVFDGDKIQQENDNFRKLAILKDYLLSYCNAIIDNLVDKNMMDKFGKIYKLCNKIKSKARNFDVEQENELRSFIENIVENCQPIVTNYEFCNMPELDFETLKKSK